MHSSNRDCSLNSDLVGHLGGLGLFENRLLFAIGRIFIALDLEVIIIIA